MFREVDAPFDDENTLRFEQAPLQRSIRLANQYAAALANHTVPGYTLPFWSSRHGAPGTAGAAGDARDPSKASIS